MENSTEFFFGRFLLVESYCISKLLFSFMFLFFFFFAKNFYVRFEFLALFLAIIIFPTLAVYHFYLFQLYISFTFPLFVTPSNILSLSFFMFHSFLVFTFTYSLRHFSISANDATPPASLSAVHPYVHFICDAALHLCNFWLCLTTSLVCRNSFS